MQAAYFRGTLVDERQHIATHVAKHRDEIARCLAAGPASAVSHLRALVTSMEAELGYLDELIAGLDRRFATSWSALD